MKSQGESCTNRRSEDDGKKESENSPKGQRIATISKVGAEDMRKQAKAELSATLTPTCEPSGGQGTSHNTIAANLAAPTRTTTTTKEATTTTIKQQIARFNELGKPTSAKLEKNKNQPQISLAKKTTTTPKGTRKKTTNKQQQKQPGRGENDQTIMKMFRKIEEKQQKEENGPSEATTRSTENENTTTTTTTNDATRNNKTRRSPEETLRSLGAAQQQQQLNVKIQQQQQVKKPVNNKRKKQQDEENQQQHKITRYMKPDEQQQHEATTTTTERDNNQQQQQIVTKPNKLMVKVKGIEITDMKKFLENKRKARAAQLGKVQNNSNSAKVHTQQEIWKFERAQRTDEMGGRVEQKAMGNSAANGISQNIV